MRTYRPLVALTVWQPYAWAIAEGLKLVENRTWQPRFDLQPGGLLAIHAAAREVEASHVASVRENAVRAGRGREVLEPHEYVRGALVALVTLDRVVSSPAELPPGQRCWWVGPYGWVFRDVIPLPRPVPCKGQQGVWPVLGEQVHQTWDLLAGRVA